MDFSRSRMTLTSATSSVVGEFRYTNGSIDVESPDITISTGAGVVGPNPIFGETVAPDRTWNGTIYYNTQ